MNKKVVILGGTGQVGSVITNYLINNLGKDYEILSCSRGGGKDKHQVKFNSLTDDWKSLGNIDYLVNCLGIIEEKGQLTFQKAHVENVKKILDNRSSIGNPKIIQISALGAGIDSIANYTKTKGIGDEMIQKTDNWMIFRPSFVCTPGTAIIQKIQLIAKMAKWQLGFMPIPAHFIQSKFQPILGDDLAEAVKISIETPVKNKLINCTGPELYTLKDWVDIATNNKVKFLPIPKKIIDFPFKLIISIFPSIMNKDQYLLLGEDNTADKNEIEGLLDRPTNSTKQFWVNELKSEK